MINLDKKLDEQELGLVASQMRRDIIRMVTSAQSGHPGGSMSSTDLVASLFFNVMEIEPKNWTRSGKGEDMFFLSAGHLAPVLYTALARRGYFPVSELATLRQFGSRLQGHPSVEHGLPGVYMASGSLGQGLSVATGAALSKKLDKDSKIVYTLLGDGESEEGQVWEAAMFAANHKVDNLIAITDWNNQQIDGEASVVGGIGDLKAKWEAFGWTVFTCDGNCISSVLETLARAKASLGAGKPIMILARTCMGKGVDFMEGTCAWHGKAPKPEQAEQALAQLKETLGDY